MSDHHSLQIAGRWLEGLRQSRAQTVGLKSAFERSDLALAVVHGVNLDDALSQVGHSQHDE